MTRSERLLAIMQFMRARRRPVTSATLAAEFVVSQRTVYRDIAVLVSQGALVEGVAGMGYTLSPGHFLPPLMFTVDEADAILLGLRYVMRRGDKALSEGARKASAKIAEMIPPDIARQAGSNGLVAGPSDGRHGDLIAAVRSSIRNERKMAFDYNDISGRHSSRKIWPVALGFFDDVELLAAWCELRSDFRHFRLDRLHNWQATRERMPRAHRLLIADYRKIEPGIEL